MRRTRRLGLAVACAACLWGLPLAGQVSVVPRQGLQFGTVVAPIPVTVTPTNAASRAELEIVGSGSYTLLVTVPAALVSAGGRTLPLRFGPGDGIVELWRSGRQFVFQPGQSLDIRISPGQGGAFVYIGGRAEPTVSQTPGTNSGTITVRLMVAGT